jgi:hypothetical protein
MGIKMLTVILTKKVMDLKKAIPKPTTKGLMKAIMKLMEK